MDMRYKSKQPLEHARLFFPPISVPVTELPLQSKTEANEFDL